MTLESGLGELASLKELTKLDISYTDHMISLESLLGGGQMVRGRERTGVRESEGWKDDD